MVVEVSSGYLGGGYSLEKGWKESSGVLAVFCTLNWMVATFTHEVSGLKIESRDPPPQQQEQKSTKKQRVIPKK